MQNTLNEWYSAIQSFVSGFFSMEIVSGVSLGWFFVSVAIFAVLIDFLFRKVVDQ